MINDIVVFEDVSKSYRMGEIEVDALVHVSLRIPQSSFTALVGPSGSGKSTALNLIGFLDHPSTGNVTVAGEPIGRLDKNGKAAFRGEKLGFIFQDFNLLPVLTVFENVEYPLMMIRNMPKGERIPAVERVLASVGMQDQKTKYPSQLSGGQKQRVAIARALVGNPMLVLADEPTANLDGATARRVMELMKRMRDDYGTTFVFSTHDARIMNQAEVTFHLEDGRLMEPHSNVKEAHHV